MVSYAEALKILRGRAESFPREKEEALLVHCCGRVLAEEVRAMECVPSFDNSAMDGFALRSSDVTHASEKDPVELTVIGVVAAGDAGRCPVGKGQCVSIMTGAMLPEGSDGVIRREDVEISRWSTGLPATIRVRRTVAPGEDVRRRGTDFSPGIRVGAFGDLIGPHRVLAMAATGTQRVNVFRRPRAIVLSTGKELAPADQPALREEQIRNSTGPMIQAALPLMGVDVAGALLVDDDVFKYQEVLKTILKDETVDLVISTGAVSVGDFDFVKSAIMAEKTRIHFHKAAIRPGKPILFAELERRHGRPLWFFGAPGNPVSTAVALRFFVNPFLRACMGRALESPSLLELGRSVRKAEGLRCFFKAVLPSPGVRVECLDGQASYLIHPLLEAQAWVVLPEVGDAIPAGRRVEVFPPFDDWSGSST